LDDIPIVREYLEVFSDDFPRLSPDREVIFVIDILLGTGPRQREN